MSPKNLLFLFSLLLFISCNSNSSTETPTETSAETPESAPTETPEQKQPVSQEPTRLIVNLENLRLRAAAGEKGKEISRLPKGAIVTEVGEVSDFTTRLKLRGVQFDEPWIKVKTESGQEGWVYGGGVNFSMDNPTALANKLMQRRLQTLFKGLAPEIMEYGKKYAAAGDSPSFTQNFREGVRLRDTMVRILEDKVSVGDYKQLPDLFWLKEAMPGYVPQLAAEGTVYYLFQDYQEMQTQVKKTKGLDDDNFVELCMMVHAFDSVEHFFPAWFLQTWDYGGHSLLGQGVHLRLLEEMDQLIKSGNSFEKEILELKDRLLHDITWKEGSFWEPEQNMKKELDDIIKSGFSILTPEDLIGLETRRKMFDDVKGNKILVNAKNG